MKKLIYLFLGLLIVACSSDDGDNNSISINSDATGSVSNLWDDGETFSSPLVWSSTSSTVTFTTTVDNETESSEYELSNNNNTVVLTRSNGIVNVYTRI